MVLTRGVGRWTDTRPLVGSVMWGDMSPSPIGRVVSWRSSIVL